MGFAYLNSITGLTVPVYHSHDQGWNPNLEIISVGDNEKSQLPANSPYDTIGHILYSSSCDASMTTIYHFWGIDTPGGEKKIREGIFDFGVTFNPPVPPSCHRQYNITGRYCLPNNLSCTNDICDCAVPGKFINVAPCFL